MNFQRMTDFLDSLPGTGTPGVDCVVMQNHKQIYRHFAGLSDREKQIPMYGNERFILYSASKVITCTAALQLYEKGAFLLTDPLYEYLPEYRNMQVAASGFPTADPCQRSLYHGDRTACGKTF